MDGCMTDGLMYRQMDGHMDNQRETIILDHYHVVRYKNLVCCPSVEFICEVSLFWMLAEF